MARKPIQKVVKLKTLKAKKSSWKMPKIKAITWKKIK
jgi:hypothetical protein